MKNRSDVNGKILLVDDERKFLNSIAERLKLLGFHPLKASSGSQALELAAINEIGMAIVDLKMPDMDGLVTIAKLKERQPDLKTVLLTGHGSEKVKQATEALDAAYFEKDEMGSFWKFLKHVHKEGNVIVIKPPERASASGTASGFVEAFSSGEIEISPTPETVNRYARDAGGDARTGTAAPGGRSRIIGETLAMQELRRNIKRFASLDCPVIIYGETGVGKELAARAIHQSSPRCNQRFTAINCGCFSNDLFVEELFGGGHEISSDAGPVKNRVFGTESRGTILLDQIEDLSPQMQLSMQKILDRNKLPERENPDDHPFDVRILAASRNDLSQRVESGQFKEELYFRLNVVELFIPPLRERQDDIAPLSSYFLSHFSNEFGKTVETISAEVMDLFMAYDFPGNVRELEHAIERAVILAEGKKLELKHFPERFHKPTPLTARNRQNIKTLAEMEKAYILSTLETVGGNKSKTAEFLGISRAALWRKLKQFKADN